jgi:hypothetical protein
MKRDHPGPSANERLQQIERNIDKVQEAQARADLRNIVTESFGRRFMYHLIFEVCGVESLSYGTSTEHTIFLEGRRDVGITVLNDFMEKFPEEYMQMILEMTQARQEEFLKRKEARTPPKTNEPEEQEE